MDRDEVLVKLVEQESIIWKRNHPQFKNITMKEQAWGRVAFQLGITSESLYSIYEAYTQHTYAYAITFTTFFPRLLFIVLFDTHLP